LIKLVVWSQYLTDIADSLNTTSEEAGIIISLAFTIGCVIVGLIATKGKSASATVPIISFFNILLFTFLGWFPIWTGSIIALILVVFMAYIFSRVVGLT
jgi:hypothetical protein